MVNIGGAIRVAFFYSYMISLQLSILDLEYVDDLHLLDVVYVQSIFIEERNRL